MIEDSPPGSPFRIVSDGLRVAVRLVPKGGGTAIDGVTEDETGRSVLRIRVAAPPADGKANAALIKLLAKTWRVPAGSIAIAAGARDRRKIVHIAGDGGALHRAIAHTLRPTAG